MSETNNEKNSKKLQPSQIIRFAVIIVLVALIVLGIYIHITNKSKNSAQQAEKNMTEATVLMQLDLENQYPKTVRDVVKLHCRILKCIYNEELQEKDLKILNDQIRQLLAEELLEENEESEQFAELLNEIGNFQSAGKRFISYAIDAEENVEYKEVNGVEYAIVYVTCNIKEGKTTDALQEEYLLVKEDGQWKILGWQGIAAEDEPDATQE